MTTVSKILALRHYLCSNSTETQKKNSVAYYNAFLFANFGIIVDKPQLLTRAMIETIQEVYNLTVPASYFANPQDMRYYTKEELKDIVSDKKIFNIGVEDIYKVNIEGLRNIEGVLDISIDKIVNKLEEEESKKQKQIHEQEMKEKHKRDSTDKSNKTKQVIQNI